MDRHAPVHAQVLDAAIRLSGPATAWTFSLNSIVRDLTHLEPGTVRTHVASRCCVNARAHHQTRYAYFRRVDRGRYQIERGFRRASKASAKGGRTGGWQDLVLRELPSGIDPTLITESLKRTPTERLERMIGVLRFIDTHRGKRGH